MLLFEIRLSIIHKLHAGIQQHNPINAKSLKIHMKVITTINYFTAYEEFFIWNMFTVNGYVIQIILCNSEERQNKRMHSFGVYLLERRQEVVGYY
jgi:hypothetical protein